MVVVIIICIIVMAEIYYATLYAIICHCRDTGRLSVLLQLLRGSLPTDVVVEPVDYNWREIIHKCYQQLHTHLERLIGLTDEQMKNRRCPLECEVYDPCVDYAMKDVVQMTKRLI